MTGLSTAAKNNLVAAINELNTGYSNLTTAISKNKGWFATAAALLSANPSATAGDYAIVGETDTVWIWDTDGTPAWKDGDTKGSVSSVNGQTGEVILGPVTTVTDGLMIAADKVKLNAIASSATANDSDANLKNRANHTGTQIAATISDFGSAVREAVLSGISVVTNAAVVATDSVLSAIGKLQGQINAHLGSGGTAHANSIPYGAAGFQSGADKAKLDEIANGATLNDSDANFKNRTNHTGTQTSSTISDFVSSVINSVLVGLSVASSLSVAATDSILTAIGKLQAQITAHNGSAGSAHAAATTSAAGFLSAEDKIKIDASTSYTHPTGDGSNHVPATGTGNNGKVLKSGNTVASEAWGSVDYSELTGKPTTLGGFSISDAFTKTEIGDITTDFVAAFNLAIA